ncbi:NirD/YgiW/YdeI family stress tolerance protein [Vibrio navarrensis]|uniref:NirD/YgiW/YdeI family stress tolerance protein n=1 Tax=Vibrio navarrensis TaxID=29495 RepID=A0AAI9G868_9VIBR|nr:NirD/YgiW/YdeI family stress tolerance protein [Vibrio navarrensis]EKA5637725.1 NirD/YgiW/YdeI family stress tolerance protein [Vibrio navarrensis]ELN6932092.1 NirD/YgiW/YdeI family stress tolerance protein [Vibrio navarrensis]
MNKAFFTTAAVMTLVSSIAVAKDYQHNTGIQFNGPVEISKVADLLQETSMFSEKHVVVEGKLVKQLNNDTFLFSDGSAEVQVEFDDDVHLTTPINETTQLRLFGEYEGGKIPKIEVDQIVIL